MTILLISTVVLTACGDDKKEEQNKVDNDVPGIGNNETDKQNENNDIKNNEENKEDETNNEGNSNQSSGTSVKGDTPDQLDLSIGDTGKFDTSLGTFDLTLDSAELIGTELDDITTELDEFILLDLTIKNTSDHTIKIEDVLLTIEITDDLELQGEKDRADLFDSVDYFTGDLEPGEEKKGQFIAETYAADEYYFQESIGDVAAGVSNQVRWTFKADEAK